MRPYQGRRQRVSRDGHVSTGGIAGVLGVQEGLGDRLGHVILVSEPEEPWFSYKAQTKILAMSRGGLFASKEDGMVCRGEVSVGGGG